MEFILSLLRIVIAVAVIVLVGVFFFQEHLIFFPTKLSNDYQFKFKNPSEEKVVTIGNKEVHSLYFKAPNAPGVILYFHGNGGALDSWGDLASDFIDKTGWSIWMVDYPGYGKSTGSIRSEAQLHDMALAIFAEIKKLPAQKKVIIYGRSLGSGIAARLASESSVDGLILETPYYSGKELAKIMFPLAPTFLVRYKFPSNEWVKNVKSPVLVVHGTEDQVIPYEQGQRLFEEIKASKRFLKIEGGSHNDLPEYDEYWNGVKKFLDGL
ncbi:alpha/beta hydrolase [Bdellovibrio bacteriovorus]|uniref:alpha/beta hydrolase n=1 Tax=Bdellovibrio bacteriovorus TaxID=959 RepID=UPI0035A8A939